jgi:hypothetical protein
MKKIFRLLLLFFLPFVLASCGDKKESAQSCSIQLDEQKYSKVSENENCTNYERASAYLGRAGMSASNFLKTGATDNLTKTLGIEKLSPDDPTSAPTDYTTGNRGYVTNALCLIGADAFTGSRSRCPGASPRTGSSGEVEISMLANIADFIYLNYGVLDNDSNGTLADTEVEGFTKLQTDGISVAGLGTGLVPYDRFEVVAGSDHYIATSNLGACVAYNDNYTVDPSNGGGTCAALQLAGSVTELRPIFKLDNMTDITSGGTLNTLVSMVSELSMISSALSSDFDSLGISSENSVRKQLTLGLSKLDNGAKGIIQANEVCAAVTVFDVMFLLVKNAADNSTTSSGLKSANLISTADLINAVDTSLKDKLLPSGASQALKNLPMQSARIVYATNSPGTTYTDSYEKAESSLYEAMKNTRSLGTDDSVKGDGKVTFRELICVAEN